MDKSFDDFFNEFFGLPNKPDFNLFNDEIMKMLNKMTKHPDFFSDKFNEDLGKPDKVSCVEENGLYIQTSIWYTDKGEVVKTIVSDDPNAFRENPILEKKQDKTEQQDLDTLKLELEKALEVEDFEKAAHLRDLINPPKKKKGRPKKNRDNE